MNNNLLTQEQIVSWLKERQNGLGGSDISAVLGHSEYKSLLDIYTDKTTPVEIESNKNARMTTGHRLEGFVADWFSDMTGIKLREPEQLIHWSEKSKIQFASIDRISDDAVIEIKTTVMKIEDPLPSWYEQATWGADVIGKKKIIVVWASIPFDFDYEAFIRHTKDTDDFTMLRAIFKLDYREYDVDEAFADKMREKAEEFWNNHIIPRIPPEPSNADDILKYVKQSNRILNASESFYNDYAKLVKYKNTAKILEDKIKEQEEILKITMQDAQSAKYCGNTLVTWKNQNRSTFDKTAILNDFPKLKPLFDKYTKSNIIRVFKPKIS